MEIGLIGSIITVGLTAVAAIIWSIRQEGRLNTHDKLFEAKDRLAQAQEKLIDERHRDTRDRLVRIETKLDTMSSKPA